MGHPTHTHITPSCILRTSCTTDGIRSNYTEFDSEVPSTSSWHVRVLCPVLPHRPQRVSFVLTLFFRPLSARLTSSASRIPSFVSASYCPSSRFIIPPFRERVFFALRRLLTIRFASRRV